MVVIRSVITSDDPSDAALTCKYLTTANWGYTKVYNKMQVNSNKAVQEHFCWW